MRLLWRPIPLGVFAAVLLAVGVLLRVSWPARDAGHLRVKHPPAELTVVLWSEGLHGLDPHDGDFLVPCTADMTCAFTTDRTHMAYAEAIVFDISEEGAARYRHTWPAVNETLHPRHQVWIGGHLGPGQKEAKETPPIHFTMETLEPIYSSYSKCRICRKLGELKFIRENVIEARPRTTRDPAHPNRHVKDWQLLDDYHRQYFASAGQDRYIEMGAGGALPAGLRGGFFVDAGALDGETNSNTLSLERRLGWTGLLVEPNPYVFPILKKKRRLAWATSTCLSPWDEYREEPYLIDGPQSGLLAYIDRQWLVTAPKVRPMMEGPLWKHAGETPTLKCHTLVDLLYALGQRDVDYLSLDTSGSELAILESWPWGETRIKIHAISVASANQEAQDKLCALLEYRGYTGSLLLGNREEFFGLTDKYAGENLRKLGLTP